MVIKINVVSVLCFARIRMNSLWYLSNFVSKDFQIRCCLFYLFNNSSKTAVIFFVRHTGLSVVLYSHAFYGYEYICLSVHVLGTLAFSTAHYNDKCTGMLFMRFREEIHDWCETADSVRGRVQRYMGFRGMRICLLEDNYNRWNQSIPLRQPFS